MYSWLNSSSALALLAAVMGGIVTLLTATDLIRLLLATARIRMLTKMMKNMIGLICGVRLHRNTIKQIRSILTGGSHASIMTALKYAVIMDPNFRLAQCVKGPCFCDEVQAAISSLVTLVSEVALIGDRCKKQCVLKG